MLNKEFYSRPNHYNKVLRKYNEKFYQIKEKNLITGETRSDILLTEEQIKSDLENQTFIVEKVNKSIASHNRMLEIEKQEHEKELQKQQEYENTYGYTDNMTPLQKGKALKILNKKYNYYDNGKFIGNLTRKDFIKMMLEKGYRAEYKTNIKYFDKNGELKTKANEYRFIAKDGTFYEITKTEYDYINHLINNVIGEAI